MNVRCSLLDGIQKHLIHEPHDRRVVRRVASVVFFLDGSIADLQVVLAIEPEGGHVVIETTGLLGEVSNQFAECFIFHQHRIGVDARGKLELIQRAEVHGV